MGRAARRGRSNRIRFGLALAALVAFVATTSAAAAPATSLTRYPYLTDLTATSVTVNWATDTSGTSATVRWGLASGGTCNTSTATATKTSITVNSVAEYQWKATLTGLTRDTQYCYRVYLGATDLLGTDASPTFTSSVGSATTTFKFDVFGDTGDVGSDGTNVDQANVYRQMASNGARFALFAGDIPYTSTGLSGQSAYGDLRYSMSEVFGSSFWAVPGRSLPVFMALGNHGLDTNFMTNWPEAQAAATSGGRDQMDTYSGADGTTAKSYPSAWYAFDAGNARIYVLDAAWANSNIGTASSKYQVDYDYHWNTSKTGCTPAPCGLEYQWLANDLSTHPAQLKFAVFHFPFYSDNASENSDTYLQGMSHLEGLLSSHGVDIVFNGHAHMYERNKAQNGIVTYVTGGGGATLESPTTCSAFDLYSIGWSYSSNVGKACHAPVPTSIDHVFHFLAVTVNGTSVTVAPTDEMGRQFDVQTYDFGNVTGSDTTPPSQPGNLAAATIGPNEVDLTWSSSSDNVGVTGYNVYVGNTKVATTTTTSYKATGLACGTSYTFAVEASDAAGNTSPRATATAPTAACPAGGIAFVKASTASASSVSSLNVVAASTAGDTLVAEIAVKAGGSVTVTSVTDSTGAAWTKGAVSYASGSNTRIETWYRVNAPAVSSVGVTLSASNTLGVDVSEWRGVTAFDAALGAANASSTTAKTPGLTTGTPNELVLGAINYYGTITSTLASAGFTSLPNFGAAGTVNGRAAYTIASSPASYNASWTLSTAAPSGATAIAFR